MATTAKSKNYQAPPAAQRLSPITNSIKWNAANGSNADKAPFLNLSAVQPATPLSSSLCAINHR
jgi:hypothetical protein